MIASRGNGPHPKDEARRQRDQHRRADAIHGGRYRHVAGAANDVTEGIEQPQQDGACKDHIGIGQRRIERCVSPAHRAVEPWPAGEHRGGKRKPEANGDGKRVQSQGIGVAAAPGPQCARNGRRYAAAHRPRGHHLHQHQRREYQSDAGERIGPELADEIGLNKPDRGLHHHHQHVGGGEPQQRRRDWRLDEVTRARVELPRRSFRHPVTMRECLAIR